MRTRSLNAFRTPEPLGYSQALEVSGASRLLFISGQTPESATGDVPDDFASQCRLAWTNVRAQLAAADMDLSNLVKVTTFLSDRAYGAENRQIRAEALGDLAPAFTVVVCGGFENPWLVEIEAIAAA